MFSKYRRSHFPFLACTVCYSFISDLFPWTLMMNDLKTLHYLALSFQNLSLSLSLALVWNQVIWFDWVLGVIYCSFSFSLAHPKLCSCDGVSAWILFPPCASHFEIKYKEPNITNLCNEVDNAGISWWYLVWWVYS